MDYEKIFYKILDFVAALCLTFEVDWTKEFPDDDYCLRHMEKNTEKEERGSAASVQVSVLKKAG